MPPISTILCAVDFSDFSPQVAEYAATLTRSFGARVLAIYVAPSLDQYAGFHIPPSSIETFLGEIITGAEQTMDTFVNENFAGLNAQGRVLTGHAAEQVIRAAEDEHADIIVMGTHGRRGFDRLLFGSVAEKVVKSAACPVLTVRPKETA
jgi:nucleotide-binding universal stress UspA family protein